MLDRLQDFTASLAEPLQWLGVMLISAIPFVESYFGSVIGVLAGVPVVVAIVAAVIGNVLSMLVVVLGAHGVRARVVDDTRRDAESPRRQRLRRAFDRYGVPGVSLLGQMILPSQITSAAMVSFGASKQQVILWQVVSIIIWGVAFGLIAHLGFDLIG